MRSSLLGAFCACLSVISINASAATIVDNGSYTTVNGVDWLDLTATAGWSYNDVTAQFGVGGSLEGWQYATKVRVYGLWNAFGGSGSYNGKSTGNNGLFAVIAPLFGDLKCDHPSESCVTGQGSSTWRMADTIGSFGSHEFAVSSDLIDDPDFATTDYFSIGGRGGPNDARFPTIGNALVRTSTVVPIPAAAWLFGSGLLGLVGMARRRTIA